MLYTYKAIKDEKLITKQIEAEGEEAVLAYLNKNGLFPVEIRPSLKNQLIFECPNQRYKLPESLLVLLDPEAHKAYLPCLKVFEPY